MFKSKFPYLPHPAFHFIAFLVVFLIVLGLKPKITDWFSLPLELSSSLVSDARALFTYKFILNENYRLRNQLAGFKAAAVVNEELERENQRLKSLLSLKEQFSGKSVAARVIARDPSNWSSGIMINKGAKQRIKPGDFVLSGAFLAGRVVEVSAHSAKIILINDPESAVASFIQRSRQEGLVCGSILGDLILRYLEKDSDVIPGDQVLVSRLSQSAPYPVIIGTVKEVKEAPQGLGRYCILSAASDLKRLEEVLVVGDK